jgi:TfoX/Sxy family transcriptional regulator of competence genes
MPYNLDLERRIDQLVPQFEDISKKKMFGGVGYLMNGNMAFGIHKQSLVIRTFPDREAELLKRKSASPFDMTGKPMKGWLLVSPDWLKTEKELIDWLNLAFNYVKNLPRK